MAAHSTCPSSCHLKHHQLHNNSLNLVILNYFLQCSCTIPCTCALFSHCWGASHRVKMCISPFFCERLPASFCRGAFAKPCGKADIEWTPGLPQVGWETVSLPPPVGSSQIRQSQGLRRSRSISIKVCVSVSLPLLCCFSLL